MTPLSLLKSPLWLAALATGAKSFADNPVIGSRRLNELGLHVARVRLAAHLADRRRSRLAWMIAAEDREAFQRDGFVIIPDVLPAADFARLRDEVFGAPWDVREMRQGTSVTRRVPLDRARLRAGKPGLAQMVEDPRTSALIRYAAATGGQPVFWLQAILSEGQGGKPDPQTSVHADTFHATAKAWFFLEDVGLEDGPFSYVPGSHRLTDARLAWEREQSLAAAQHPVRYHARGSFRARPDDLRRMQLPDPVPITVRANTLVVADTFGFHARTPSPRPTCRVELYASLRRNPFLPWTGLDPLALPLLRDYSGSAGIAALTALRRLGLAKMPWRPAGRILVNAPARR